MNFLLQGLYVLIDPEFTQDPLHLTEQCLSGGATLIQLRCKKLPSGAFLQLARQIQSCCAYHHIPLIINDRPDIALLADADGVHLGQEDLNCLDVRSFLKPHTIIGVTVSSLQEARNAQQEGADYVCVGHIFETSSKVKKSPPVGLSILKEIAEKITIPVMAIGGIDHHNIRSVLSCKTSAVAVIGAVSQSNTPKASCQTLVDHIHRWNSTHE